MKILGNFLRQNITSNNLQCVIINFKQFYKSSPSQDKDSSLFGLLRVLLFLRYLLTVTLLYFCLISFILHFKRYVSSKKLIEKSKSLTDFSGRTSRVRNEILAANAKHARRATQLNFNIDETLSVSRILRHPHRIGIKCSVRRILFFFFFFLRYYVVVFFTFLSVLYETRYPAYTHTAI